MTRQLTGFVEKMLRVSLLKMCNFYLTKSKCLRSNRVIKIEARFHGTRSLT